MRTNVYSAFPMGADVSLDIRVDEDERQLKIWSPELVTMDLTIEQARQLAVDLNMAADNAERGYKELDHYMLYGRLPEQKPKDPE